jgi:hypothetical protein
MVEPHANVVLLATPFIVLSSALTNAAKVDPEYRETSIV